MKYLPLLLLFFANTVLANDVAPAMVIKDAKLVVKSAAWMSETVHVRIVAVGGLQILSEELYNNAGEREFDLSRLPSNRYVLSVENKYKLYQVLLQVDAEGVQRTIDVTTYDKPNAYVADNHIHLDFDSPEKDVVINLYDDKARKVDSYSIAAGDLDTSVKLRRLRRGKYVAHISNGIVQRVLPFTK
jgi:hypothetical protein